MCWSKKKLLEIRFDKNYWCRDAVKKWINCWTLDGCLLNEDIYCAYYRYMFYDKRLYKHYIVRDFRLNIMFIYGKKL